MSVYVFSSRGKAKRFIGETEQRVVLFLSLDSFLCTSEFLGLGASNHVQAPHPDLPPQMTQSSNANEAAQFRVGARLRTTRRLNLSATEYARTSSRWPAFVLFKKRTVTKPVKTPTMITIDDFQNRLRRPGGNIVYWQDAMTNLFDAIWRRAAASFDGDPNSKDANVSQEVRKDEDLRTCRSTLAGVLRPELRPYFPQVLELLEDSQTSVSMIMEELSVIALKSVHLIADGIVYGQKNHPEIRLSDLLPAGFRFRDPNVPQTVKIAPLPSYLDSVLENEPDSNLTQLLSQEYLQFVYSRLLREQGASLESADIVHPMWKNLVDAMKCEGLTMALDGLSRTMLGHIKQYATALSDHRDGTSYGKL